MLLLARQPGARAVVVASQVANVLFTVGLASRLAAHGGTAVCLHPGVVRTRLLDALTAGQHPPPSAVARALAPVRAVVERALRRVRRVPEGRWLRVKRRDER
jgi:NAD(P)-dependent dehydrogenase (short-subunit alcohol dehydrogenase family)